MLSIKEHIVLLIEVVIVSAAKSPGFIRERSADRFKMQFSHLLCIITEFAILMCREYLPSQEDQGSKAWSRGLPLLFVMQLYKYL